MSFKILKFYNRPCISLFPEQSNNKISNLQQTVAEVIVLAAELKNRPHNLVLPTDAPCSEIAAMAAVLLAGI
jgi:hypothetical protein